jgi:LemA protein
MLITAMVGGIILLAALWLISTGSACNHLQRQAEESWVGIYEQLKRRHEIFYDLLGTLKHYAQLEWPLFDQALSAYQAATTAHGIPAQARAEGALAAALQSLFALAESYPDLKADHHFLGLQHTAHEVDDQLRLVRRFYNAVVRDLNIRCDSFPWSVVAAVCGLKRRVFFDPAEAPAAEPVKELV